MAAPQSKVLFITVHYKTSEGISALLKNLERLEGLSGTEVIVVDNASGCEELAAVRSVVTKCLKAKVLESPTNLGYFGAARLALDRYLAQKGCMPDWTIVCNHDVVIEDQEFFLKLFRKDPKGVGVLAPRIQTVPGAVDQNPFMAKRPGWLRWLWLRLIYSTYGTMAIWNWLSNKKKRMDAPAASDNQSNIVNGRRKCMQIYAPHGAFLIFSRRYFDAGGYLDDQLFLYFEEIAVAEICRSLRLPIVYDPSLNVLHAEHQSTGDRVTRFSYECHKTSLRHIRSRYLSAKVSFPSAPPNPIF